MSTFDCADPIARRAGLEAAADAAASGQLVVLPTDTVYGIGADAFNAAAVRALLAAKGRGPDMPVPVLVGSWTTIEGLVTAVPPVARTLVEAFWPGGLSLVIEHAPSLRWDLGEAKGTVMVRMPLHPVAIDLLREVGPMAVSSANISGRPEAGDATAILDQLGEAIELVLDGGAAHGGPASTVVDCTGERPRVVRPGAIPTERISEILATVGLVLDADAG